MKKWYDEEYEWEIEVIGFLRGDHTEQYCRNGEEIGDRYTCTYGLSLIHICKQLNRLKTGAGACAPAPIIYKENFFYGEYHCFNTRLCTPVPLPSAVL